MTSERHLSRIGRTLRESAIRRSGDLAARMADVVSFAPGFPDPQLFAWDEIREIAASILGGTDRSSLQYGLTRGYPPLLAALPGVLADRSIRAGADEIVITTGSQQGLDLCARLFIDPGNVVLVELPTYTGAITASANAQARLVGVEQDTDGIAIDALTAALDRERTAGRRVAFLYVIPNFQNPTGMLTSLERRLELVEWAEKHDVLIVEDDPYGALYFDDVTSAGETRPIKADDRSGRVVYLSSFSKTIAPGLRVAWMTAPPDIASRFEIAKQSTDLCSSSLDQRIVFEVIRRGILTERLPLLRQRYRERRTDMEQALIDAMGSQISWPEPRGGFFLWATFAEEIDTQRLLARAVDQGVVFVPGSAFYVERINRRVARLAFSAASSAQMRAGAQRLAAALDAVRNDLSAAGSRAALPSEPRPERSASDRARGPQRQE